MKKLFPLASFAVFILLAFSACETPGQSALTGAAAGAAIGGLLTGRPGGALAGAAVGAGTGYLVGKQVQSERRDAYDAGYADARGDGDDRGGDYDDRYPVGRFTHHDGFVISPYPPYNRIDVRGIPHGAKVQDPSTGRIFINP